MKIKRAILAVLAGTILCVGIYFIIDAALTYRVGEVYPDGMLEEWLFGFVWEQSQNKLAFYLGGALSFLRFIPALALFDFLFCLGEKKWSHAMLGIAVAICTLLALSLAAEPFLLRAGRALFEGGVSMQEARTPVAVITACRLLVLCAMAGLAAAYIAVKHKYYHR